MGKPLAGHSESGHLIGCPERAARGADASVSPSDLYEEAIRRIDAANAEDPNREVHEGQEWPKELLYGRRMSKWLERIAPDASEPLRLAARAQHIRRWEIPRDSQPRNRSGYLKWRTSLYRHHADVAGGILKEIGYDEPTIERVRDLLFKKALKKDPEAQVLEDVVCLVFLENYFADFSTQHDEEKIISILRKTWHKMGERGRAEALKLRMPEKARALLEKALAAPDK